jgi:hypothetical protein
MTKTYVAPSRGGKVNVAFWTTDERRRKLKMLAAETGKSMAEILEPLIDRELAKREKR